MIHFLWIIPAGLIGRGCWELWRSRTASPIRDHGRHNCRSDRDDCFIEAGVCVVFSVLAAFVILVGVVIAP